MSDARRQKLIDQWSFNWGVMDVMIGGRSSIDLNYLRFPDMEDATRFLTYYGYDPDDPADARYMHSVIVESLCFIQTHLMPAEWARGKKPPAEILNARDVRELLLLASGTENSWPQLWACALLRMMHTIAHIQGVWRHTDIRLARQQIMSRFNRYVFVDRNGKKRFGTKEKNVLIDDIQWKAQKARDSLILKLLHKKANVAETIYDLLGVRIVTERLCDVMVVVKYLRDFHMITFPNCNPGRSRNSLLDTNLFRLNVDMLRQMLEESRINPAEFSVLVPRVVMPLGDGANKARHNPHSGTSYKSIQLTCRQLINCPDQGQAWRDRIRQAIGGMDEDRRQLVESILEDHRSFTDSGAGPGEPGARSGFFPFEVHILDKDTAIANKLGDASHDRYKRSQIRAARRRVLGGVLTYQKP